MVLLFLFCGVKYHLTDNLHHWSVAVTELKDRLKQARKHAGITQAKLAEAINTSQGSIADLESGRNKSTTNLLQIANILRVNAEWLATGKGEMTALPASLQAILDNTSRPISTTEIDPNTKIWLPLMDISFSCGDGVSIDCHFEETKRKLAFDPDFLISRGIKEQNVRLLYATGDSMEMFIFDGDIFAVDISDTIIRDGQIYAVYFEGEAMLKQIFKEAGGTLILHSLNPKYKDKIVTEDNGADFKVIGRQFWRAG